MAWIESHEELPTHRKTRRVARRLDASVPQVIGHLHCLWYWCLTHAPDGYLGGLDAEDIADAAMWDGDPETFVKALVDAGWLDDTDGGWQVHDWWEHAGQTVARKRMATDAQREAGMLGAHRRWHIGEDKPDPNCPHCDGVSVGSDGDPNGPQEGDPMGSQSGPMTTGTGTGTGTQERPDSLRSPDDDFPDGVCTLTRRLATAVAANGHKTPSAGSQAAYRWFEAVDKLLRLDQADPDEVAAVIDWATADEFWAANIRSAGKLREQYSRLRLQRRSKQTTNGRHGGVTRLEDGRELAY